MCAIVVSVFRCSMLDIGVLAGRVGRGDLCGKVSRPERKHNADGTVCRHRRDVLMHDLVACEGSRLG